MLIIPANQANYQNGYLKYNNLLFTGIIMSNTTFYIKNEKMITEVNFTYYVKGIALLYNFNISNKKRYNFNEFIRFIKLKSFE